MSDDPTRSHARPGGPGYGRVGPVDPREDPVTRPAMPLPDLPPPDRSQPGLSQPGLSQPGLSQPGMSQPGMSQPGLSQPGLSQPGLSQPGLPQADVSHPGFPHPEGPVLDTSAPDLPARGVSPTDDTVPVPDDGRTVRTPLPDALGPGPDAPTVATPGGTAPGLRHSRAGGLWTGLIASAVVLILLLVFILQNGDPVVINFLGFSGSLPTGVALLFAAVAGLLLVAIPGGLRMLQLRRVARRGLRR